jgi:hypothetical protein
VTHRPKIDGPENKPLEPDPARTGVGKRSLSHGAFVSFARPIVSLPAIFAAYCMDGTDNNGLFSRSKLSVLAVIKRF